MNKLQRTMEINKLKKERAELMKVIKELKEGLPETPPAQFKPVTCIKNGNQECSPISCTCICNFEDIIKRRKEANNEKR